MPFLIEMSDSHFAYPGHPGVLTGAGLRLEAGERLCLTGANGAGKSTLLHILVGLLVPERGTVAAFGRNLPASPPFEVLHCKIGVGLLKDQPGKPKSSCNMIV